MNVADFIELYRYNRGVRTSYLDSLPWLLPWDELAKNRETAWLSIKASDVLMHVFTEEVRHRGEIIAMLWQMDVQPPDMGWASTLGRADPPWHMK